MNKKKELKSAAAAAVLHHVPPELSRIRIVWMSVRVPVNFYTAVPEYTLLLVNVATRILSRPARINLV